MIKAIKARWALTARGKEVLERVVVVVEGDRIKAIGNEEKIQIPEEAQVIDLGNNTLLPGLIDLHVHLALNGEPSFEGVMTKELVPFQTAKAAAYLQRDLNAGITTIRSVGDKGFLDVGLKQAINDGFLQGPRLAVSGHMLTITGGRDAFVPGLEFHDSMFAVFDGPAGAARAAREQLKYSVDWIKVAVTGAVTAGDGVPGAQQPTLAELEAIVECAEMYGKRVVGHAHGAEGIKAAVKAGFHSIEHAMLLDEEGAAMMVEGGVYLVPTLAPVHSIVEHGIEAGIPRQIVDRAKAGMERHLESFAMARDFGIKIGMGNDTGMPFVHHGENVLELELMVKAGMEEYEAILTGTATAAQVLGWEDRIGSLEAGKLADIIAVPGEPLGDIGAMRQVEFVMKGGEVIKT